MNTISPSQFKRIQVISQFHPHHLTLNSPWPILTANATLSIIVGGVLWFNDILNGGNFLIIGIITTIFSFILWFRDIVIEGVHLGHHTQIVQSGLSIGVSLFIVTEVFFFLSIFWAYFHSSLSPTEVLGSQWPPAAIVALSPITVPLLNTILLVSSGATITFAHHAIFFGSRESAIYGLIFTIILAIVFTGFQGFEYVTSSFNISDGAYGSCFYFSTGFHGFHVFIGTLFITVGLARIILYHFTKSHHLGLESSILYWH